MKNNSRKVLHAFNILCIICVIVIGTILIIHVRGNEITFEGLVFSILLFPMLYLLMSGFVNGICTKGKWMYIYAIIHIAIASGLGIVASLQVSKERFVLLQENSNLKFGSYSSLNASSICQTLFIFLIIFVLGEMVGKAVKKSFNKNKNLSQ